MSAGPVPCASVGAPLRVLLDPSADLVDPPQCSTFFEPKEWSRRYADTFFTADVVAVTPAADAPAKPESFEIRVQAGDNVWAVTKTAEQFEQLAKQLSSDLLTHKQNGYSLPALPHNGAGGLLGAALGALGGGGSSSDESRRAGYSAWLRGTLSGCRKMCLFPALRAFLDLDRELARPVEEDDDEEDGVGAAAAPASSA